MKYNISELCFESFPCKHYVTDTTTNVTNLMCATEIYTLLQKEDSSNPHFDYCAEYIRKRDFPTNQELEEQKIHEFVTEKILEKQRLDKIEQEKLNMHYKSFASSSYLERLKQKHLRE
jgi:hypothetical protein